MGRIRIRVPAPAAAMPHGSSHWAAEDFDAAVVEAGVDVMPGRVGVVDQPRGFGWIGDAACEREKDFARRQRRSSVVGAAASTTAW